jgi:hypothetical protein
MESSSTNNSDLWYLCLFRYPFELYPLLNLLSALHLVNENTSPSMVLFHSLITFMNVFHSISFPELYCISPIVPLWIQQWSSPHMLNAGYGKALLKHCAWRCSDRCSLRWWIRPTLWTNSFNFHAISSALLTTHSNTYPMCALIWSHFLFNTIQN